MFRCISNDSPSSRSKSLFSMFFVPLWIWSCFCVNRETISFSLPDFVDSEIVISGLTSLTDFFKRVYILIKKPKNISLFNYEKQQTTCTNVDANVNLADAAHDLFNNSRKQTCRYFSQNYSHSTCETKLKLRYFSYVFIPYQI